MRVLINQTTRMGDMLQTSPLVRQLRLQHPDAHIAVMVRGMGKLIAEHIPDIDEIILYNEDDMFLDLRSQDSERLLHAYTIADGLVQRLRSGHYDLAFNVTHSISSAMLIKMAGIPKVIGAHLSDDWQFVLRGSWTTYFFTSVFSRDYNDLNLCDISRHFASETPDYRHLVFEVGEAAQQSVDTLFAEHHIHPDDFVACLQLGASENNKRWLEVHFADLAKRLREKYNAKIVLLGVKDEAALGDVFEQHAPGLAIPLYGKTSVPQVAALLQRSRILITNDTGTMHIAAAVDCPITLVSVGHVHYRETGPYGVGHCAIEWRKRTLARADQLDEAEKRGLIRPEQVMQAVNYTLQDEPEKPVRQIEERPELHTVDMYITRFAPDGCLQFYPAIRRAMTERDFMRIAYRTMWLHHLEGAHQKQAERESIQQMLSHFKGPEPHDVAQWVHRFVAVFSELAALSQQGVQITQNLLDVLKKKKGIEKARAHVSELSQLDEEARLFSELHPESKPLILIARYERDNLEGADPLVLAQTTLTIYRNCYQRARLLEKKIRMISEQWNEQFV